VTSLAALGAFQHDGQYAQRKLRYRLEMRTWNRLAVVVEQPFRDWLRSVDPTSADLTLADLQRDPTVYLLPEADDDPEAAKLLAAVCEQIFEEQLDAWYRAPSDWPQDRGMKTSGDGSRTVSIP